MNGKKRQKREKKDNKRPCVPTAIVRTKSLAKIWGMVKNSVNFKREISLTGNAEEVSTSKMYNKNVEIKIARSQNNHYSVNVMNEIKTKSNVNNNAKRKRGEKANLSQSILSCVYVSSVNFVILLFFAMEIRNTPNYHYVNCMDGR